MCAYKSAPVPDWTSGIAINSDSGEAALASDVSVAEFSQVGRLLVVHGRRCASRSFHYCISILNRAAFVLALQVFYAFSFYMNLVPVYDYFGPCLFCSAYVLMPVVSMVFYDDVLTAEVMETPQLYFDNIVEIRAFPKKLLLWTVYSLFQGAATMWGCVVVYSHLHVNMMLVVGVAVCLSGAASLLLGGRTHRAAAQATDFILLAMLLTTVFSLTPDNDTYQRIYKPDLWLLLTAVVIVTMFPINAVTYIENKWIYEN